MNSAAPLVESAWIKLHLLVYGIEIDDSVSAFLQSAERFAVRKNVYNNPVWRTGSFPIPQELRISNLVVGLNSYGASPWNLRWLREESALLIENYATGLQIQPELIPDLDIFRTDNQALFVANLYGGAALAFFSPRNCYFFSDGSECGFCSLAGTAEETDTFKALLSEEDVRRTTKLALEMDRGRIEQIMIVGGNMRDLNKGFSHHVSLAAAAALELENAGLAEEISVHIATMPPRDLDLLRLLGDFRNIHVMFNLEVWDPATFSTVCPGKDSDYGRTAMLHALERLRDAIGPYRAHSLLVTGLESAETTSAGATALAEMGISPIINVYHSDRHSRLGLGARPSFSQMVEIALALQNIYDTFPILPYWRNCGRNAIDAEAQRGLFRNPVPGFLTEVPI